MSDEKRMKQALIFLGNHLRGDGFDALKPISVELANNMADLAFAVANGEPHERFDALCAQVNAQSA